MAEGKRRDTYANMAYLGVVESAQGTLTFERLEIAASSLLDKKFGLLINRADFAVSSFTYLNSSNDSIEAALTVSDGIVDLSLERPEVLFEHAWFRLDIGAAATGIIGESPSVIDFSTMPGGGILVPANRLYIAVQSSGASAACRAWCRLYYTVVELSSEDYWQLVESRHILST